MSAPTISLRKIGQLGAAWVTESQLAALVEAVKASVAYRIAEERADSDGGWQQAQEAAVVLDAALERFTEEGE